MKLIQNLSILGIVWLISSIATAASTITSSDQNLQLTSNTADSQKVCDVMLLVGRVSEWGWQAVRFSTHLRFPVVRRSLMM